MPTQLTFDFGRDHVAANDPAFSTKLARRIARDSSFYGSLSSKRQYVLVMQRDGWKCKSCNRRSPEVRLTIHHLLPVEVGGDEHCLANQCVLCVQCHNLRTSMDALKYGWVSAKML